jgi:transcriptional regulator with XRE-family HTH domain
MRKTNDGEANITLGEVIAHFRQRLRRPSGPHWSQEDLAFAIGADQAHMSRIESNRLHPQYSTLTRICDVLDLSSSERLWVLTLAGHQEMPPLPDRREVAHVIAELVPRLESLPYPAMLNDEGERLWYYNGIAAALLGFTLGLENHEALLARIRGKIGMLELISNSDVYERWKPCWENVDDLLIRWIALLWRVYRIRQHDPHLSRGVTLLKSNPELLGLWERVERGDADVLFLEQGTYALRHPKFGRLHFHSWRTHFAEDERFFVTHCTPMDSGTSRVFGRLLRKIAGTKLTERTARCESLTPGSLIRPAFQYTRTPVSDMKAAGAYLQWIAPVQGRKDFPRDRHRLQDELQARSVRHGAKLV